MLTMKAPGTTGASIPLPGARADLEAAGVVSRKQREVATIGVLARAGGRRCGSRRSGIVQEPQRRHRPIEFVVEEIATDAKVAGERAM
jgi:hypothetical protein